jgi:hypothetical protein
MEHVASLDRVRLVLGIDGFWLGLAPDDSPLVLRDVSGDQLYALGFEAH